MEFTNQLQIAAVAVAVVAVAIAVPSAGQSEAKAGCESSCGNISIPYPFGTAQGCYMDQEFLVVCDKTFVPPRVTLQTSTIQILSISLLGEMTISNEPSMECYDSGGKINASTRVWMRFGRRFRISSTKNKLTVIGWNTLGIMRGNWENSYVTGCFSFCRNIADAIDGSCSGVGCCQSTVPLKAQDYNFTFGTIYNRSFVSGSFNSCSYAFVVQDGYYNFSTADLFDLRQRRNFPMVLDWSVQNQICLQARENDDYACRGNSTCKYGNNVDGYQCFCHDGYNGNPYLHGCTDIDECESSNDCHEKAKCENTNGGYNCLCPEGYYGDGLTTGSGCTPNQMIVAKTGCESSCGNISIPYPFGTARGCYMDKEFLVVCNKTINPPTATLQTSTIQILNISLLGEMTISNQQAMECYDSGGKIIDFTYVSMRFGRFRISSTKNKLTVIGWDTLGIMYGNLDKSYATGCFSFCRDYSDANSGSCSGVGCCQSTVPLKTQDYNFTFGTIYNRSFVSGSVNSCSYAFVVQDGYYNFSKDDLNDLGRRRNFPMVLDWSVGNQICPQARENDDYACRDNSTCKETDNVAGYQCLCLDGYNGNPYLHGCTDINECKGSNDCHEKTICENTDGGYNCLCPKGYHGDGLKSGSGCTANPKSSTVMTVGLSISTSLLGLLSVGLWILWALKRRKLEQLRKKFFHQNGGMMMLQQLSSRDGSTNAARIFTEEDLKKATKNFHESRILGQGGQGTVYKGILADKRVVAIKKARIGDESQVKDFVNEVALLFNVSHKNVVKLLGCCFETQVPTLIYEYVSHGSLLAQLKMAETSPFPWELRLKIATETAEALWYLHSQLSTPIIHRDIKSANILLDGNYVAKMSDFGASRLIQQDDESQKDNTAVQGTIGYLDPEYIITQQLNEKSDVYSFGVVLVELLTGESVTEFKYKNPSQNLLIRFLSSLKADLLSEILDPQIRSDKNSPELKEVAALAGRCVRETGLERPSMKEVFSELEGLRAVEKTRTVDDNGVEVYEEKEELIGDFSDAINGGASSSTAGYPYDSIKAHVTFDIVGAR